MGRPITLLELRTRALQAADMSTLAALNYLPLTEQNQRINDYHAELRDLCVLAYQDLFVSSVTIDVASGTREYQLPADFYKYRHAFYTNGPRDKRLDAAIRIMGNSLIMPMYFRPGTISVTYIPQCPFLEDDTDTIDANIPAGWEVYIAYGVAKTLREKAALDASGVTGDFNRTLARIKETATPRQASGRRRSKDVRGCSRTRPHAGLGMDTYDDWEDY